MAKIILDIDGVFRNIHTQICNIYKRDYDINSDITPNKINQYSLQPSFPLITDVDEFFKKYGKEIFYNSKPYNRYDCVNLIRLQRKGVNTIHFVTDQKPGLENLTLMWLQENSFFYDSITFDKDKTINGGDIILDDYTNNLLNAQNKGLVAICMDRPWNKDWPGARIKRFDEFLDIVYNYNKYK